MKSLFESCIVNGNEVTLTYELSRDDYVVLKSFFESIGGKYKANGTFTFKFGNVGDLITKFQAMDIDRKSLSFFPTPTLALEALVYNDSYHGIILEPQAGQGAIIDFIINNTEYEKIVAVEIDPVNFAILEYKYASNNKIELIHQDFLTLEPFDVQHVIMNPPFSVNKKQVYQDHVNHAIKFLSSYATLESIVPVNIMFRKGDIEGLKNIIIKSFGVFDPLPKLRFGTANVETYCITYQNNPDIYDSPYEGYSSYRVWQYALYANNSRELVNLPYTEDYYPSENGLPLNKRQLEQRLITMFPAAVPSDLVLTDREYLELAEGIWPDEYNEWKET